MKEHIDSFRKGWEIFQPFRKKFAVMMALMILTQITWQAGPFLLGKIINSMQEGKPISNTLLLAGFSYFSWLLALAISFRRAFYQENNIDYAVERHLANKTLEKFLSLSLGQHRSQSSGITQSVVSKGRGALEQMVFILLYTILPILSGILITIGALLWFHWGAGSIVLAGGMIFAFLAFYHNEKHYPNVRRYNNTGDEINKHFGELLRNASVVQLNSQEKRVYDEHDERLGKWGQQGQDAWVPYIKDIQPQQVLIFTIRILVLVLGIFLVYRRGYKIGDFVILVSWSNQATNDFWQVAPLQRQWLDLWSKVKKYFAVLDVEPTVRMVPNPIPVDPLRGRVEFKGVSYTYSDQKYVHDDKVVEKTSKPALPALVDVNFTIMPGERVAFVGRSGAGKSTLLFLLTRGDDPHKGQILIDDNDLRLVDLEAYRKSIGLVEQNVLLFDNTIRYNMLFGLNGRAKDVSDEEIEKLAAISKIDSFKDRLTDGWETKIGENGVRLSGGERQRVSIARALAKDSRLLLLDEATSNLDGENERHIKEAIHNASVGRTTIIIAHRLSTVHDADRIYVMDHGSIVAQGKHGELCEISPIYRRLVKDQLVSL